MIDLGREQIVTFREATELLPRRREGRKANIATLYRWTTAGCRGVRLESIQIGGSRCTSREAMQRFFDALASKTTRPTPRQSDAAALRRAEAAGRELDRCWA